MRHELPDLTFPKNALEPILSAEALDYHHDKHHRDYVDQVNHLIVGTEFENLSLEEIVVAARGPLFNAAAQAWNHAFLWQCLAPGGKDLRGELLMAVERDFGSVLEFREQFAKAGVSQFGSGWVWLVLRDEGKLAIKATANAENPLTSGETPLLTCDVWEHAYYLDYRNERPRYVESVFKVLDWEFAERNFRSRAGLAA